MFPRTIKFKIIAWFLLSLAGILLMFSLLVYSNLKNNLYEDTDDLLLLKAEGVVDYVDAYWKIQKQEGATRGERVDYFFKSNSLKFVEIAQTWVKAIPSDPKLFDIQVRLYDAQGELLVSSESDPGAGRLSPEGLKYAGQGRSFFMDLNTVPVKSRAFVVPIVEGKNIICVVEVRKPLTFVYAALRKLKMILFLLWPLVLVVAILTGVLLARLVLRPLRKIVQTVQAITAENLKARVSIPDTKDEIKGLADTFNSMLDELDHAFTSQRQIVQDISHELRTPLTILKGEIEVALNKLRSVQDYQATLASSLEEINKMNRIVEDILTLARLDSQQVPFEMKKIALSPFLQDIVSDAGILAAPKNIQMTSSLNEVVWVHADEVHLRRAILNILDNAIKYTPAGGSVHLKLLRRDQWAEIRISDTGVGIASEHCSFIFDRFYRVDPSRSSKGFGLGLSLAKTIIESHQGKIEVESVLSSGTTFYVLLPLVASPDGA